MLSWQQSQIFNFYDTNNTEVKKKISGEVPESLSRPKRKKKKTGSEFFVKKCKVCLQALSQGRQQLEVTYVTPTG